jgi:hypothetical protein
LRQSRGFSFEEQVPFGAMIRTTPLVLLTHEWIRFGSPPCASAPLTEKTVAPRTAMEPATVRRDADAIAADPLIDFISP